MHIDLLVRIPSEFLFSYFGFFWVAQGCSGTHGKGRWASHIALAYVPTRYDFVFEPNSGRIPTES